MNRFSLPFHRFNEQKSLAVACDAVLIDNGNHINPDFSRRKPKGRF